MRYVIMDIDTGAGKYGDSGQSKVLELRLGCVIPRCCFTFSMKKLEMTWMQDGGDDSRSHARGQFRAALGKVEGSSQTLQQSICKHCCEGAYAA